MNNSFARAGLLFSLAVASIVPWATAPDRAAQSHQSGASANIVVAQRKDVDEASRPPPPSGPSSQSLTCNPSSPDCP